MGYEKSIDYFNQNLAISLKLLIVIAKARLVSKQFSILEGLKSIYKGTVCLLDMLIGLPPMITWDYSSKLIDEERKFLVAELKVDVNVKLTKNSYLLTIFNSKSKKNEQENYIKYCELMRLKLKDTSEV